MPIRTILVALLCSLAVGASAQTPTGASFAGKTGSRDLKVAGDSVVWGPGNQILFVSQLNHEVPRSLYTYDLATSKLVRVTNNGWEGSASWTPGFTGLFFSSYGPAKDASDFSLWYLKLGGKPQQWYKAPDVQYPSVSPDGRWVVASTSRGLILVSAENPKTVRSLTSGDTVYDVAQEWSPDSRSVLFTRRTGYRDDDEMQIARVDVETGAVKVLTAVTQGNTEYHSAHVGPDGKLYVSIADEIRRMDGATFRVVVKDSRDAWGIDGFAFSPDGTALIYERHNQGGDSVLVLKALTP